MERGKGMGNYEVRHKIGSSKPVVTCEQKQSTRSNSNLKGGQGREGSPIESMSTCKGYR